MYFSDFFAVTEVYLGKTQPSMRMSSSLEVYQRCSSFGTSKCFMEP